MKNKIFYLIILSVLIFRPSFAQDELRGVWIAWAGSDVPSKEKIAQMMEDVAAANMNTVYVDVWRFGYPYFKSDVYYNLTGLYTDPNLEDGRDILAEMIAEAHRIGLHVEAWFEYGFVVSQGDVDHIYQVHPEWFAKKRNGSVLFNGDYRYKWLSHCNPHAQQFLIDLCQEVALNYDVDGIEFDRVRYPELDCGYDSATVALYKAEHNGAEPPQNIADSGWMRWRADKLTDFISTLYDSLKAVRPDLPMSNAPIVYSYGYENFCQDWRPWINENFMDYISPQVYRSSSSSYTSELDKQLSYVTDRSKLYPGLTSVYNTTMISTNEIVKMIQITRNKGLQGHVIWYYNAVVDDFPGLVENVYQQKVKVPNMPENWREQAIIINENDPQVQKSSGWTNYSGIPGFDGGCMYVKTNNDEWIEYYADIPHEGWYEIYCYNITQWSAAMQAPYQIYHSGGIDTTFIDQTKNGIARWYKIGDCYLHEGMNQKIVRLTNSGLEDNILFADAIMILNTNRPLNKLTSIAPARKSENSPARFNLFQNYPNPFNPKTTLEFSITDTDYVVLKVYNVQGSHIKTLVDNELSAGTYAMQFYAASLPSGIYFYKLQVGHNIQTKKMVMVK